MWSKLMKTAIPQVGEMGAIHDGVSKQLMEISENLTLSSFPSKIGNQVKLVVSHKRMAFILTQKIQEMNLNAPMTIQASAIFYLGAILESLILTFLEGSIELVTTKGKKGIRTGDLTKTIHDSDELFYLQQKIESYNELGGSSNSPVADNNRNTFIDPSSINIAS